MLVLGSEKAVDFSWSRGTTDHQTVGGRSLCHCSTDVTCDVAVQQNSGRRAIPAQHDIRSVPGEASIETSLFFPVFPHILHRTCCLLRGKQRKSVDVYVGSEVRLCVYMNCNIYSDIRLGKGSKRDRVTDMTVLLTSAPPFVATILVC